MRELARAYYESLRRVIDGAEVWDANGRPLDVFAAIEDCGNAIVAAKNAGGKLMFIGNGANAGIASHISSDFSKNAGIPAMAFNDPVLLTAAANDCGVENMFAVPLEVFARKGDVLIALSSSGSSPNIVRGIGVAAKKGCRIITISGFKPDNPMRKLGERNFYSPADAYALVEVAHHSICHCLLDCIIRKSGRR